jgi:choline-phosphate cytidylyltransferase
LGKFKATQRTEGISTTDVVGKILKNKEIYYYRNISRGAGRKDLGLSWPIYMFYVVKQRLCPARNH